MRDMLAVRNLSFAHDAKKLFVDASLTIDDGQRVALLGKNGAGKSTLLAMLAGELAPDDGTIERGRGQSVGLLAQEPHLDAEARVADVARAALAAVTHPEDEVGEHRIEEVLSRLGVTQRAEPVRTLSGGGRRRLDVARLLLQRPDILLLDEPTNHLDVEGIDFLVAELRRHRGVVLFVSHDRAFVDEVATRIVEVEDGALIPYPVPTEQYLEQKLLREEHLARTAHRQRRLYVRELAWLRAGTPARTTKQQARIQRAEALAAEVEEQAQKLRDHRAKVQIEGARARRLGKSILETKGLVLRRGERTLVDGLDLSLVVGDRWGIVGENGAGKTTLLNAILTKAGLLEGADAVEPVAGTLTLGLNTTIAVFDQHRAALDAEATLEETLAGANDHVSVGERRVHIATYLEQFLFDGADRYRRVKTLSGGQQNRLVLARMFQKDANLLLLDEPTNDLDVETLGVLEDALLAHEGVALIVSHDRRFLDRIATGILAFEGEGRVVPVPGDWTNYVRLRAQRAAEAEPARAAVGVDTGSGAADKKRDAAADGRAGKRKRSWKEEQELKNMEEKILAAEARREELQATLNAGEVFRADPAGAKAMTEELPRLESEIETMYARWQELEQLLPM
jgi:ABC transport system ATP-binding/permease protein